MATPFVQGPLLEKTLSYTVETQCAVSGHEMVVEIYNRAFAATIDRHFDSVRRRPPEITLLDVDRRTLPIRVRDALAWLLTPYL